MIKSCMIIFRETSHHDVYIPKGLALGAQTDDG